MLLKITQSGVNLENANSAETIK